MDHGQLEMRGRIVHGEPAVLRERDHEERAEGEEIAGAHGGGGVRHRARDDLAQVGRARTQGQGEDGERHGGLGQRGHGHLAARAHAAESGARVESGQREEEGPEKQEIDDDEQVADGVEGRRHREHRDEEGHGHRAREDDEGRRAEEPRGVAGDDDLLGEELAQLEIGLPHGGAAAILETCLEPPDQSDQTRGQEEREHGLGNRDRVSRRQGHHLSFPTA